MLLVTTWFGSFLLDDGKVVHQRLFPKDADALDELQQEEKVLLERLREWYGLHFPELAPVVDTGTYVDLIAMYGRRDRMPIDGRESIGANLPEREEAELKAFAGLAKLVQGQRKAMESYLERSIREIAPNVSELGAPVAAIRRRKAEKPVQPEAPVRGKKRLQQKGARH